LGAKDVLAVDFDLNVPAGMVAELDFLVAQELSIQIGHAAVSRGIQDPVGGELLISAG
jgi:hypothetical protein